MSVKYPNLPDNNYDEITSDDRKLIDDQFKIYHKRRQNILAEKNYLLIEKMVSYGPNLDEISKKIQIINIKQKTNNHDILFLKEYPIIAIRHVMGLSWGTTF